MENLQPLRQSTDHHRALELIWAAWEEGEEGGLPSELMAYAAIYTAMTDLVANFGEDAVASMARGLEERVQLGEFSAHNTRQ